MKILPTVLLLWPYLCLLPVWAGSKNEALFSEFIWVYIILTVVVYILNIINACVYKGENAGYRLAFWNMLIKLFHIPFYLTVFLLGVALFVSMVVPALVFFSPIVIAALFVIDLFLMITSSMYGVNALLRAVKQGEVSQTYALVHGVLHFFFVADIVSAICVFVRLKKRASSGEIFESACK